MAKDPLTGQPVPWNDLHRQYIDGSVDGDLPMTRLSEMFNVNHFVVSQVNPHVVPFLPKDDVLTTTAKDKGHTVPRWLHTMAHLAKDELLHRMTVLLELGVFPTSLTKVTSVVKQRYAGDITIYPEVHYANFPRILKNPTTDFMLQALLTGERATWPKFSRIRNHCAIELALDSAIQTMRARVTFSPSQVDLRYNNLASHSIDSFGSSGGRGRMACQRRSSYSQEMDRTKRSRCDSFRPQRCDRRRARSLLSSENAYILRRQDPSTPGQAAGRQTNGHQGYFPVAGDGPFGVGYDGDKTGVPFPERPEPPSHRASWGHSSVGTTPGWPRHRPAQSRASSWSSSSVATVRRRSVSSVDLPRDKPLSAKTCCRHRIISPK